MAALNNDLWDELLQAVIDATDEVHLCSAEPTTYTEATSTYSLGNGTVAPLTDWTGPEAATSPYARKITLDAFTGLTISANGTATHLALVDSTTSTLIYQAALSASVAFTTSDTWNFTSPIVIQTGATTV